MNRGDVQFQEGFFVGDPQGEVEVGPQGASLRISCEPKNAEGIQYMKVDFRQREFLTGDISFHNWVINQPVHIIWRRSLSLIESEMRKSQMLQMIRLCRQKNVPDMFAEKMFEKYIDTRLVTITDCNGWIELAFNLSRGCLLLNVSMRSIPSEVLWEPAPSAGGAISLCYLNMSTPDGWYDYSNAIYRLRF